MWQEPFFKEGAAHAAWFKAVVDVRRGLPSLHPSHPPLPIDSSHIKSQSRALIEEHKFNGLRAWKEAEMTGSISAFTKNRSLAK